MKIKEFKFQIQNQTFRTMKSIEERKGKSEKKKLFSNQLIRLIARLRRIDLELAKLKKVDFSWNKP